MQVETAYVVYQTIPLTENSKELCLEKVKFKAITANRFESEEDAIEALENEGRTFQNFLILKSVTIYNFG